MYGSLSAALGRKLGEGWHVIAEYEEGSYQGKARIAGVSYDGTLFADGEISWGSCSYCDPWYNMSVEEIASDLDRSVDVFTREQFVAYLTAIARLDTEELGWYDRDAKWAREALNFIGNNT